MKEMLSKLIPLAVIMILFMIFIFLYADCKIENEKLQLKVALLEEENEKIQIESGEIRKTYTRFLVELIHSRKMTLEELSELLPRPEMENFLNSQERQAGKE